MEDFWRMLWETESNLIVRLQATPSKMDPCADDMPIYWQSSSAPGPARFGFFVVDPVAEYQMPGYVLREFRLTDARDGRSRTVRQFDASSSADLMEEMAGELIRLVRARAMSPVKSVSTRHSIVICDLYCYGANVIAFVKLMLFSFK
ncbi:unnamed protein product [Protopolystoma xenopodis]|uniref:Tyrosine-protein phosphatase domain-containing protein n=1 Tax=Protopolystoma xenopodis TaxID=117903 RepID=A0A3S5CQP9_9PLAT|nr:unnamed protein product [Protopolystoma xenopodis]